MKPHRLAVTHSLILNSCEGYGTHIILYLKTEEAEAIEKCTVTTFLS